VKIEFENIRQFGEIKKRLLIIARATSEDKLLFIQGVSQQGGLVGFAGKSSTDADAL